MFLDQTQLRRLEKLQEEYNESHKNSFFEEELKDFCLVYQSMLSALQDKMEECIPPLLHHMDVFVNLNNQADAIKDKLEVLLDKIEKLEAKKDEYRRKP